jgi:hypothetical protein
MAQSPTCGRLGLVGGVVVADRVQFQDVRVGGVDRLEQLISRATGINAPPI